MQEAELNEKLIRLNELNAELDLENGTVQDMDLTETKRPDSMAAGFGTAYGTKTHGREGK